MFLFNCDGCVIAMFGAFKHSHEAPAASDTAGPGPASFRLEPPVDEVIDSACGTTPAF